MSEKDEYLKATAQRPAASAGAAPADTALFTRAAWARILPFLTYIFFIFADDMLQRMGWAAQELRWLYAVKIGAVMLLLVVFWRQYTELRPARLALAPACVALATGLLVLVLWINLDAGWMLVGSPAGFDPHTGGRIDYLMVAVRIFGAALVVPVMEELFWRSFLMRWIEAADFERVDPAHVRLKSFIVTVILFGFEHNLWLAGIVAGAAYSVLYVRYRTLWSPILAHAVTNGLLGVWIVATGSWTYW